MELATPTPHWLPGLQVMNADRPLAKLGPQAILARIAAGTKVKDLAVELGVTHPAIYVYLLEHCPDEWRKVSSGNALARYQDALDEIEDETKDIDGLTLARRREQARFRFAELAVLQRRLYGQDTQIAIQINLDPAGVSTRIEALERELGVTAIVDNS